MTGGKWTDPQFPPVKKNLCPPEEWDEETYGTASWERCHKIPSFINEDTG